VRKHPLAAATAIGAKAEISPNNIPRPGVDEQRDPARSGPFAEAAEFLWRAGLTPIPLTGDDDGKPPNVSGFTRWSRRPGLSTLARWSNRWPGSNIGIVTGHRVTVIDIDDDALIDEMIRRFGATPLQVRTPSGGLHLYYRSSGERCGTLRPGLPVDIKGVGGYVVAPPSIRPSGEFAGQRYQIVAGSWDEPPGLPPLRPGGLQISGTKTVNEPIPLRSVRRGVRNRHLFRALLRHAPYCDDHDALLDVARTIAAEQFVSDPLDPFDGDEIEKTVRSAWRYETEERNWVGRRSFIRVPAEDIAVIESHPHGADMALLYLRLRRAHWDRPIFAAPPKAMADHSVIPGWRRSHGRYRRALAGLVEVGTLRTEKIGGSKRGDANLYSFTITTGGGGAGGGGV
jgi:hypothetical protein